MQRPRGFLNILIIFTPLNIIENCSGKHTPELEKHKHKQIKIKCQETIFLKLNYKNII
jgi:hypothetical protein|tara:strand:- start:156 stop:329 length:174 start_codon:yes stop_codon:yes gene_type:complete